MIDKTKKIHPKGDIRRLKYLLKTDIKANINKMNEDITLGANFEEDKKLSYGGQTSKPLSSAKR